MGCNFYTMKGNHIGKRSAAGMYCWDCKTTLCVGGESKVHNSESGWSKCCPHCGKEPAKETLENGAVGRELGFNKSKPVEKKGVRSCASFSWAMVLPKRIKKVKDEYGRKMSLDEFLDVLKECPIQYYDLIGKEFC